MLSLPGEQCVKCRVSEAMGKRFLILSSALVGAFLSVSAAYAALDNPFAKAAEVNIGADIDWDIDESTISKTGEGDDGLYYRLALHKDRMILQVGESRDVDAAPKAYRALAVEDISIDGKRLPLFQWCLNNQQNHNRFLQQGLEVKDGICVNRGERGEVLVKLNKQTLDKIEQGKRLRFTIRPYRKPVHINYDISDFGEAYAVHQARVAPKPVVVTPAAVAPVAKEVVVNQPATVKMCRAVAPKGFASIHAVEYVCNDISDRRRAENKIAAAVKKEKQRRQRIAAEKEKQRLAAIAAKKKAEEERRKEEEARKAEEAAIAASEQKHSQIMDELTRKMVGVCNKMWKRGKHRCYCEKYIEYAPAGIKSDPSCNKKS